MAGKPIRKKLVLTTIQPARVEAFELAPIHSKISAYVGELFVDYGDRVKQGQPLLSLAAPELDAALLQKKSLLERANAQVAQLQAGVQAAEAGVVTAQSKIALSEAVADRAQADVVRWKSELARIEQLASTGSVNRQIVDETQQKLAAVVAAVRGADAETESARASVLQAKAELAIAISEVVTGKADVSVAEANLVQSQAEHSYLVIRAPFDGVVTKRAVDPGQFVQSIGGNAPPLLTIARDEKLRVTVAVPENEAMYVDVNDTVTLQIQSVRDEVTGHVSRTSFALDVDNRSLDTFIDLDNSDLHLRPGLYAMAKIVLQVQENALTVPASSVVRQDQSAFCFRFIDGKATRTPIQPGIKVGDEFEITGGISDSDTIIFNKAATLKDGQAVAVAAAP